MRRRDKKGSQTFDRALLKRMIMDNIPIATVFGVVRKFPGEDSHFEIQVDENGNREVMVDVEIMPRSERAFCRLGFGHDQIFRIPRVDQEVAVIIPTAKNALTADELDADGIIVAILDTDVPAELDDDDVVVITAPRVIVLSESIQLGENAEPLATLADVQHLTDRFNHHGHLFTPGPGSPIATPGPVAEIGPPAPVGFADDPEGTDIVTGD
jgi:hypothetical protein